MLLHVVESARPVDAAQDVRAPGPPIDDVNNVVTLVADIEHIRVPDLS
jgi:hypothetical protein